MALLSKEIKTLDDLYTHQLQDIYYAEKQIEKALPKMIDKAKESALRDGFKQHLEQTHGHVARLERVFEMEGKSARAVDCPAIDGIIKEAEEVASEVDGAAVLDAALTAAAQAVEHYEITRYGTQVTWAKQLGRNECADLLRQTLDEEKATDAKLTELAKSQLNAKAA